MSSYRELVSIM